MYNNLSVCVVLGILTLLLAGYLLRNSNNVYNYALLTVDKPRESFQNISAKPCTFALFRQAYKSLGYFPSGGQWIVTNGMPHYQPDVCKFQYVRVPSRFVMKCLSKANISRMLTAGDSTASRYNAGLRRTSGLKFVNLRREALKEGGFLPDVNYFAKNVPKQVVQSMKAKFRFCSGCATNLNKATFVFDGNKSHSLTIEHTAQTMILDDSLEIVFPSYKAATSVLDKVWAITSQELIFRYYLNNTHPDVFLVFLPFFMPNTTFNSVGWRGKYSILKV